MYFGGIRRTAPSAWIVSLGCLATLSQAAPLGTAFTYQGQLKKSGDRVTDTCSFQFTLWDDPATGTCPVGGNQVGPTLCFAAAPTAECPAPTGPAVAVAEGLFTVQLDFGVNAFEGSARWLQMSVQCSDDAGFTALCPRQELTAAPYSLQTRCIFGSETCNVGIGTSQPGLSPNLAGARALTINGGSSGGNADQALALLELNGVNTTDTAVDTSQIRFLNNGIALASIVGGMANAANLGFIRFVVPNADASDSVEVMRIKTPGRVGIGTNDPQSKLHIGGTPGADGIMFPDGTLQTTAATPAPVHRYVSGSYAFSAGVLPDFDVIASAPANKRWFVVAVYVEITSGYASDAAFRCVLDTGTTVNFPVGNFGSVCGTTKLEGDLGHMSRMNGSCNLSEMHWNWSGLDGTYIREIQFGKLSGTGDEGSGNVKALVIEF